jgi:DHA1 family multidrug resistance protein-like MFS transporter
MSDQSARRENTSWPVLLILFTFAVLVDAAFFGHAAAFTPLQLAAIGLSPQQVVIYTGLIASISFAIGIPFLPLWGALADRYSRQPVIVRSFAFFLVAGALMYFSHDVITFAIGRTLMAFALGNTGLMMTTLAERIPANRLGLAYGIMNGAAPLGFFSGVLLGGPIVDHYGFSTLMLIDGGAILLVILALAFGYRDSYQGQPGASVIRMAVDSVVIAWQSAQLRMLFIALFVLFSGWQIVLPYIPLVTTSVYRGSDPGFAIGLVTGLGGIGGMLIGPLMGSLGDRFGRWRILFVGTALAVILLPLPLLSRSMEWLIIAWGLANGVLAGTFATSFSVLSDTAPQNIRGRVMAFAYLPVNLGSVAGPALGSLVATADVWLVFPAASLSVLIGIGVLWLARKTAVPDDHAVA